MKFKIGDHVRVISRTDRYFDEVGMVVEIDAAPDRPFRVSGLFAGYPLWYAAHELILAEPEPQTSTQGATGVAEGVEVPGGEFGALREAPSDPDDHASTLSGIAKKLAADYMDAVNHPPHYVSHPSGVECIQITEHMGFNLGNAIKYIWRADLKNDAIEDLRKAEFYIKREIQKRERA